VATRNFYGKVRKGKRDFTKCVFPTKEKEPTVLEAREREQQEGVMKFTHTHIMTVLEKM
jgi:hypothetical protein